MFFHFLAFSMALSTDLRYSRFSFVAPPVPSSFYCIVQHGVSRSLRRIPHLRSQGAGRDRTPCFPCSGGTVFESVCRSAFRESVRRSPVSVRATLPRARRYEDGRYVRRGDAMRAQPQREAAYYLPQGAPNRLRHRHDLRGSVRPIGRLCRTAGDAAQCGRGNRQTGTKVR